MKKYIYIVADTNDGDYISELNEINDETLLEIVPVIDAIQGSLDSHNWWSGEYADTTLQEQYPDLDERLIEIFEEYVPYGEYGIHTIEKIEVFEVSCKTVLL